MTATAGTPDPWRLLPHLDLIDRCLVDAALNASRRYIVVAPPRHGKSDLISHWSPAWFVGMFPSRRVILASYGGDFAASWGRKARDELEEHGRDLFGVRLRQDSHAANRWDVERFTAGRWRRAPGGMTTAGTDGPVTGKGAHLLVIDDPVKGQKESLSPAYRRDQREWYLANARTRLEPGGSIVLLMTRWHLEDLAGWLLEEARSNPDAEQWTLIHMPAIAEAPDPELGIGPDLLGRAPGEALWPDRYDVDALAAVRAGSLYWWSALYQGRPIPAEGLGKFQREWFAPALRVTRDAVPDDAKMVRRWDRAATDPKPGEDPDWTAGALLATNGERTWCVDIFRFRGTPGENQTRIRAVAEADRENYGSRVKIRMEQEPGSSGKSDIATYQGVLHGFAFRGERSSGPKPLRADPVAAAAEAGTFVLCAGEWNHDWIEEAVNFPHGDHDDQVDAVSGAWEDLHGNSGKRRVRVRV